MEEREHSTHLAPTTDDSVESNELPGSDGEIARVKPYRKMTEGSVKGHGALAVGPVRELLEFELFLIAIVRPPVPEFQTAGVQNPQTSTGVVFRPV